MEIVEIEGSWATARFWQEHCRLIAQALKRFTTSGGPATDSEFNHAECLAAAFELAGYGIELHDSVHLDRQPYLKLSGWRVDALTTHQEEVELLEAVKNERLTDNEREFLRMWRSLTEPQRDIWFREARASIQREHRLQEGSAAAGQVQAMVDHAAANTGLVSRFRQLSEESQHSILAELAVLMDSEARAHAARQEAARGSA